MGATLAADAGGTGRWKTWMEKSVDMASMVESVLKESERILADVKLKKRLRSSETIK